MIVPDLPGSGRSSLLPGEPSVDAMADAMLELCDHAGIGQCIMIGHSMGGYTALAFAEKYPGRLKAFSLFHSTTYADSEERVTVRKKMIEFIEKNGSPAYIRQSIPNLLAESTRKDRPGILDGLIARYSDFKPESLIYYQEAMIRRPDRTTVLRQFAGPVHFVIGSQDITVPPEHSLQQCHIPALSQVDIIEGSAHMAMLEDSDRTNKALTSFITFTLQTWTRSS
jgi:pimeloyl-ACP methyl ester carboxylesterase